MKKSKIMIIIAGIAIAFFFSSCTTDKFRINLKDGDNTNVEGGLGGFMSTGSGELGYLSFPPALPLETSLKFKVQRPSYWTIETIYGRNYNRTGCSAWYTSAYSYKQSDFTPDVINNAEFKFTRSSPACRKLRLHWAYIRRPNSLWRATGGSSGVNIDIALNNTFAIFPLSLFTLLPY